MYRHTLIGTTISSTACRCRNVNPTNNSSTLVDGGDNNAIIIIIVVVVAAIIITAIHDIIVLSFATRKVRIPIVQQYPVGCPEASGKAQVDAEIGSEPQHQHQHHKEDACQNELGNGMKAAWSHTDCCCDRTACLDRIVVESVKKACVPIQKGKRRNEMKIRIGAHNDDNDHDGIGGMKKMIQRKHIPPGQKQRNKPRLEENQTAEELPDCSFEDICCCARLSSPVCGQNPFGICVCPARSGMWNVEYRLYPLYCLSMCVTMISHPLQRTCFARISIGPFHGVSSRQVLGMVLFAAKESKKENEWRHRPKLVRAQFARGTHQLAKKRNENRRKTSAAKS